MSTDERPSDPPLEAAVLADRIAVRSATRERVTDRRRAWQERASVLAWFRPGMIDGPTSGEERLRDEEWRLFLADTEPAPTVGRGARRLREPLRRAVLQGLGTDGAVRVRAPISGAPADPLQEMLDRVLAGTMPSLEELDRPRLDALYTVSRWLTGILPGVPTDAMLTAVCAREDLLAPLRRLTENFVGREDELDTIRLYTDETTPQGGLRRLQAFLGEVIEELQGRKVLVLWGHGGVGKSTLVARFLLERAARSLPFVYIDLDRPSIDPRNPFALLAEAQRQLTLHLPEVHARAERLEADLEQTGRERAALEASRSTHSLDEAVGKFVALVADVLPPRLRLPFVIDTFEEAQALGDDAVPGIADLVSRLRSSNRRIRPVICGRVAPDDDLFDSRAVPIRVFEPVQAVEFLRRRLQEKHRVTVDPAMLHPIVTAISRTPLSLSLAAQIIAERGVDEVPRPGFVARLLHLSDEAELYSRVLGHLTDPQLRALAKPGLLVRRLTAPVVWAVLAKPCGLSIADEREAAGLLERFERAVSLVEREPDGALRHRQDVRLQMLPSLEREVGADVIERINRAAVDFYADARPADSVRFAERLYHLLRLGEVAAAEALWNDPFATAAVERLRTAVPEMSPQAARALKLRLNLRLTADERKSADQDEWERAAARAASARLADGAFEKAARILGERNERLPGSPLPRLEMEAWGGLGEWRRVLDVARPALDRARRAGDPREASALLFAVSRAYEALGDSAAALRALDEAEEHIRRTGELDPLLRVAAARARITGVTSGGAVEDQTAQLSLVEELKASGALERLSGVALREVAAALGAADPSLARAALFRLGLPPVTGDMISRLARMLAEQSRSDDERSKLVEGVMAPLRDGQLPTDRADPHSWERWLTEVPRFHLGRALAQLIGTGAAAVPGLLDWVQAALQGRVDQTVHRTAPRTA